MPTSTAAAPNARFLIQARLQNPEVLDRSFGIAGLNLRWEPLFGSQDDSAGSACPTVLASHWQIRSIARCNRPDQ